jgi:DnaJ-class molecular chaperone
MDKVSAILQAKQILNIGEKATLAEIKAKYKRLLRQWHPDKCQDQVEAQKRTVKLNQAYEIIEDYCQKYLFSFIEADIKRNLPAEERYKLQFSSDAVWGVQDQE